MKGGDLSGEWWNGIQDELIEWAREMLADLKKEMLAGGYPPFTEPTTLREKYDALVAARQAGDPRFYQNPKAMADLEQLSLQFGPPPPVPVVGGVI